MATNLDPGDFLTRPGLSNQTTRMLLETADYLILKYDELVVLAGDDQVSNEETERHLNRAGVAGDPNS